MAEKVAQADGRFRPAAAARGSSAMMPVALRFGRIVVLARSFVWAAVPGAAVPVKQAGLRLTGTERPEDFRVEAAAAPVARKEFVMSAARKQFAMAKMEEALVQA